ncbi:binding motif, X-linked-like-1 isoform X2 [Octopus vulgaris]|uniref:Binding motif, X-linked-like-1 isoform X2 n=2 Tax=Octopus TaxID=6643 RepID=A0AA36FJX3_OCTVU|nr:RNA binding motif protein, X-linked-like-1 isoform X2 [Octopus sinensis]CAI9736853.1 binding motif, X-linked-like-1 isoform X2 [Octopus vulgaris]
MVEKDRPGKIFVGGLSPEVDEKLLENLFGKYGKIIEILIIRDKESRQSRGYAFVTFENPLDAEDAVKAVDGMELKGREIHCEQAILPQALERNRRGPPPSRGSRGRPSLLLRTAREKLSKARRGGFAGKPIRGRPIGSSFRGGPPGRLRPSGRGGPPGHFSPPSLRGRGPPSPPIVSSRSMFRDSSRGPPISSRGPRDLSPRSGPPRRGIPRSMDSPPRRSSFDDDYNSPPYWEKSGRSDRLSMGVPERGPLRSRDFHPAPSPPREMRREYRSEREFREFSPRDFDRPSFREKISSRMVFSTNDGALRTADRGEYISSDRDLGSSRSSRDYISPRYDDLDREYSSRNFVSREHTSSTSRGSRSYGSSRESGRSFSSHNYDRGVDLSPREYDSYRSYGPRDTPNPNRGPPSRSYSSYGPSSSTHRSYISSSSRGGPSSSCGPPPSMSSRGPAPPISSRGPPLSSRGPPPMSSRGPPMSRRGSIGSDQRGEYSREVYPSGSRRPAPQDSRGPSAKRPRGADGPSRSGPPFRR